MNRKMGIPRFYKILRNGYSQEEFPGTLFSQNCLAETSANWRKAVAGVHSELCRNREMVYTKVLYLGDR